MRKKALQAPSTQAMSVQERTEATWYSLRGAETKTGCRVSYKAIRPGRIGLLPGRRLSQAYMTRASLDTFQLTSSTVGENGGGVVVGYAHHPGGKVIDALLPES